MNDDDFERKLLALTRAVRRPDPTPAWKSDILARARREANSMRLKQALPLNRSLPPRWLMLSWAAAWIAIVAMNLTQPRDAASATYGIAGTDSIQVRPASGGANGSPLTLLAFQRNLKLDLP